MARMRHKMVAWTVVVLGLCWSVRVRAQFPFGKAMEGSEQLEAYVGIECGATADAYAPCEHAVDVRHIYKHTHTGKVNGIALKRIYYRKYLCQIRNDSILIFYNRLSRPPPGAWSPLLYSALHQPCSHCELFSPSAPGGNKFSKNMLFSIMCYRNCYVADLRENMQGSYSTNAETAIGKAINVQVWDAICCTWYF